MIHSSTALTLAGLLASLALGASPAAGAVPAQDGGVQETGQGGSQELRVVTLDITGMT